MRKAPKHKIILIGGVVLVVVSPLLFFVTPETIFGFLCASEDDSFRLFPCVAEAYIASLALSSAVLVVGVALILWALRGSSRN